MLAINKAIKYASKASDCLKQGTKSTSKQEARWQESKKANCKNARF